MAPVSFVPVALDSHFSMQNIPYGVFRPAPELEPRPGVAIGDFVLDLSVLSKAGLFDGPLLSSSHCFLQPTLNSFMALGRSAWKEARATIQNLLSVDEPILQEDANLRAKALIPQSKVKMELPASIGDYTDFLASPYHALNCNEIFSGKRELGLNWLHMPIAYHGRASSIVVSGTPIARPIGQRAPEQGKNVPEFGPSICLDFELEVAFFVGPGNDLGSPVTIDKAMDHIFGLVLMNDWSARDIQGWESNPLGPFLGKSFGTTISPWIVTLEALEPFICDIPIQDPQPLPYLRDIEHKTYDIPLEAAILPEGEEKASSVICRTNFKYLYWTIAQQLAHHTVNGCNLKPGDLLASGTISGPDPDSLGCLLEASWGGTREVKLEHGASRKYLLDGDKLILSAFSQGDGFRVGFGSCAGTILPAKLYKDFA